LELRSEKVGNDTDWETEKDTEERAGVTNVPAGGFEVVTCAVVVVVVGRAERKDEVNNESIEGDNVENDELD